MTDSHQRPVPTRTRYNVCRAGTLLWKLPDEVAEGQLSDAQKHSLLNEVCSLLDKDSRVTKVERPDINTQFTGKRMFYPVYVDDTSPALMTGSDAFSVLSLSFPILLSIHVPKKNQPQHHGVDDVPTDDYRISWDGISVLVLWQQDKEQLPISGGHIVAEILQVALSATGAELYVQNCGPACDNVFFHTDMRVHVMDERIPSALISRHDEFSIDVSVNRMGGQFGLIAPVAREFQLEINAFSRMKNVGRRTIDIESSARGQLNHLLGHYYDHASVNQLPFFQRIYKRWTIKGWRREARHLLAGLWLSLANLEMLRRQWQDRRDDFRDDTLRRPLNRWLID